MTKTLQFSSPFFKHLLGWAIFITYEVSFVQLSVGKSAPLLNYASYYALNIGLFYFNAHGLLAGALHRKLPYLLIVGLMVMELLVYLVLKYLLDRALGGAMDYTAYLRHLLVPNLYRGISFLGTSILYWSVLGVISFQQKVFEAENARLKTLKEKAELERNLAESINAYLQQQINPHLLFNTLTFIHNTYYQHAPHASRCVLLLADIMRFSFEGINEHGKTPVEQEIEQVRNFIELNQLRFSHELYMDVDIDEDFQGMEIIPLVLLTLTENTFKHGYLKDPLKPARLSITRSQENELRFYSWNLKKHEPENKRVRVMGISNLIKRLDFSYKDRYTLVIEDVIETYEITLIVYL